MTETQSETNVVYMTDDGAAYLPIPGSDGILRVSGNVPQILEDFIANRGGGGDIIIIRSGAPGRPRAVIHTGTPFYQVRGAIRRLMKTTG